MTSPALTRPPRVTTACLFVGLNCLLLLMYAGSTLSNWGSIEVQEQVRAVLEDERLSAAGLEVSDVMGWLRWVLMGAAAVASAGIIFAIYTARGHQASRIILTIMCGLASLVFLASGIIGILFAALSIFFGIYLWTADARQWFAVKNGKVSAAAASLTVAAGTTWPPPLAEEPGTSVSDEPGPAPSDAEALPVSAVAIPSRPKAVLAAGIITLVGSWISGAVGGLFLFYYAVARDELLRAQVNSPAMDWLAATDAEIAQALDDSALLCAVIVPLSALAVASAIALLMGKKFGRTATLVLAYVCVPLGVVSLVGIPWAAAAIVVIVLLRRPESRSWFSGS